MVRDGWKGTIIAALAVVIWTTELWAQGESSDAFVFTLWSLPSDLDAATRTQPIRRPLGLGEALAAALQRNGVARISKLDVDVAGQVIRQARGAFDPRLIASYSYEDIRTAQNTQQFVATGGGEGVARDIFFEENNRSRLALEGRLPTGATYNFEIRVDQLYNALIDRSETAIFSPEYQGYVGVTLRQPILKDFGTDIALSDIRIARIDQTIARYEWQEKVTQLTLETAKAFFDLLSASRETALREGELSLAREVIRETELQLERGLIGPRKLSAAHLALADAADRHLLARRRMLEEQSRLLQLIEDVPVEVGTVLEPTTAAPEAPEAQWTDLLEVAWNRRPDLLRARAETRKENLKLRYARNQMLPQIDLTTTLALNGLAGSPDASLTRAFEGQAPEFRIGFEASFPIGNNEAIGRKNETQIRRRQAIIQLHQTEAKTLVELNDSLNQLALQGERLRVASAFRRHAENELEEEARRVELGEASTIDLIEFRKGVTEAAIKENEVQSAITAATLDLWARSGQLLEKLGVSVEEPQLSYRKSRRDSLNEPAPTDLVPPRE